ncbi:hypothetical protein [Romeriopsis navalis]|nr:hypothetical protein [Romeriopsis navalis]
MVKDYVQTLASLKVEIDELKQTVMLGTVAAQAEGIEETFD